MQIEQGRVQATITPCRGGLLVVIERTPHPGRSDFVRQHARRPWLTGPQPEEVLRRLVPAEEAVRLLFREDLHLSLAEQDGLTHLERRTLPCLPGREATFLPGVAAQAALAGWRSPCHTLFLPAPQPTRPRPCDRTCRASCR